MIETFELQIVIDTETRIIKTASANPNIPVGANETLVKIPNVVKIYTISDANTGINTYWKRDNGINIPATQANLDAVSYSPIIQPDGTGQYWKLDLNNKKIPADPLEVDALGIDPVRERIKREQKLAAYKTAAIKLTTVAELSNDMKDFFVKLVETL